MRRLSFIVALLLLVPSAHAIDLAKMVETIRMVENSTSTGRAGEESPWQILPSVWRQYSKKPISWARGRSIEHRAEQRRVVLAHIAWIQDRLKSIDLAHDSPYNIALVWCAGFETVRLGRASAAKRDYAGRAQNIYESLK
jgi:hypothetical protein